VEIRTLLSGYLLSSQGDRMLMGNSVEGRFPFLDKNVVELAFSLPDAFKLKVLDEKHVLKRAAKGRVPEEIVRRPKQPYRAPDALAFTGPLPEAIEAAMQPEALREAGVFEPEAAGRLWNKVRGKADGQFSNADNMALVGVLSTQLLHQQLVARRPDVKPAKFDTVEDRVR
jgi:asparagine synthase (glutamine-hydrolysing)